MKTRKLAILAIFMALMLVLGYIESLIPVAPAFPGVKLGLANSVLVYILLMFGWKEALLLMFLKVVLSGLLFSGISGMLYALSGGLLSMMAMIVICRVKGISEVGISVTGAVMHNVGQMLIAILVGGTVGMAAYFPLLFVAAIIMGVATGFIAKILLKVVRYKNAH
ncbi:MAG: Gx transporter family protein [Clostridia bacterium]|nr:Gx transporter family protein [Clostridia bacterium]